MKTKRQYMAPALEVVELYEDLMLGGASANGDSIDVNTTEKYNSDEEYII